MTKKKEKEVIQSAPFETEHHLSLFDEATLDRISGPEHNNLRAASKMLDVRLGARGRTLHIKGEPKKVEVAAQFFDQLNRLASKGREFSASDIVQAIDAVNAKPNIDLNDMYNDVVFRTKAGKHVVPKGPGQHAYVKALRKYDITFGVGPAGTGKTYLAMAAAVSDLLAQRVSRIVLTRPAVEAGEHLGFLPGNFEEKVLPYLRPLYDALFDLLGSERAEEMVTHGIIEIAPLAFMRGRTLNDAFIILDEAQNATREQMKMFLTRLGFSSRMAITGDVTQIDLPVQRGSGLLHAVSVLGNVEGIAICRLTDRDVVRHHLVQSIVRAYEAAGEK
jgi:phosphate starvation-inducible PhoH-like protein